MPYEKLQLGGAKNDILSWANHEFSIEEQNMLRNVSRLPCLFKHVALMPDAHLDKGSMRHAGRNSGRLQIDRSSDEKPGRLG